VRKSLEDRQTLELCVVCKKSFGKTVVTDLKDRIEEDDIRVAIDHEDGVGVMGPWCLAWRGVKHISLFNFSSTPSSHRRL